MRAGRQLAGRERTTDEDPELEAIVELCMDLGEGQSAPSQPSEMPPQMHWGPSHSRQHVSRSREELHTGVQSVSFLPWDVHLPYSYVQAPGFLQGPGTQTNYSFERGSADMWGSPESLGEGPSTSAGFSSMLQLSADGSVPTASAGYSSYAFPPAGSAPPSFQGFHVPSFAAPLNVPLAFDDFNAGWVLRQAQPRAQPGAPTHLFQPTPQRGVYPAVFEAVPVGKRKREKQPTSTSATPSKKLRGSSRRMPNMQQMHETTATASLTSAQQMQLLLVERDSMMQGPISASNDSPLDVLSSDSLSSSHPFPATPPSQVASGAPLVRAVHQTSTTSAESRGSSPRAHEPGSCPEESVTAQGITSATSPTPPLPRRGHPFYWTPALQPGATTRPFSLVSARSRILSFDSIHDLLRMMRSLLMKDMIVQADLEVLVCKMETLVGYLLHFHTTPVNDLIPKKAVISLGFRYIILDFLFVAREVLGEAGNASSWWQEVVASIPHEVEYQYTRSFGTQFEANMRLVKGLSGAIEMLKNGIRPSMGATILLKRRLFCKATSPPAFKGHRWDPWRNDDQEYRDSLK
ncbi:uncharacterized protein EMH_0059220 [Eimeria mitis]|uniref:Uncharacterized protein n=1 Tax=Eimeria mitis TaxID=44415 RepID=U6KH13_9EIME|nr:uncharacterized protein EMH_0059220 [Eimeria mitis]CDJ36071.1 hypothetical protein, conserved [Eimeria mitis]